jgi:hypothetical protein
MVNDGGEEGVASKRRGRGAVRIIGKVDVRTGTLTWHAGRGAARSTIRTWEPPGGTTVHRDGPTPTSKPISISGP